MHRRIETMARSACAAASFAAAVGYALIRPAASSRCPNGRVRAGAAAIVANLVCCRALHAARLLDGAARFSVRAFEVPEIEP